MAQMVQKVMERKQLFLKIVWADEETDANKSEVSRYCFMEDVLLKVLKVHLEGLNSLLLL